MNDRAKAIEKLAETLRIMSHLEMCDGAVMRLGEAIDIVKDLSALPPDSQPAGEVVMVPREPTQEMLIAALNADPDLEDFGVDLKELYQAMLAAAPAAAQGEVTDAMVAIAEDIYGTILIPGTIRGRERRLIMMRAAIEAALASKQEGKG